MARLGISDAFAKYGAVLRNPQWSVSAWAPDGSLVISLWQHHHRKGAPGTIEFTDSLDRWAGPGNAEARKNIAHAFAKKSKVLLVIVKAVKREDQAKVEAGEDASNIPKEFFAREDLIGEVTELNGPVYVFRFQRM